MCVVGVRRGAIGRIGSRLPLGVVLLLSGLLSGCAQSINITPAHPQVAAGTSAQLTATSLNSDGQPQDVTAQVTWSSSNSAVASVSAGTVSGLTAGSVTISAHLPGASGSTRFTVSPAALVSLQLTPAAPSLPNGLTEQFSATGVFADNSTQDLTQQVRWSSSSPAVAAVSNSPGSNGLASATGVGSSTLTAASGSVSASTTLTVTAATLVSIQLTPATPSTPKGLQQPFTAIGIYSDNSTADLSTQVSWSSSAPAVASISNAAGSQGLASTLAPGSTTISATRGSISGSTLLTVTAASLVSITVTPTAPSVANGSTQQFTATGSYTDNSTQNITTQVTWSSSSTSVATISNAAGSQGLASSAALGSTTISASSGGISGSTDLIVSTCANGFIHCEVVTIDHTQVGNNDSSDFPMLFSGTYSYLATAANGGSVANTVTQEGISVPADAVFTSDPGCTSPLNWEFENYAATTGTVIIWVQVPTLSHTTDTAIYLCVGKSSVSSFQGGATGAAWDSSYVAVYHLPNGTTLSANDSSSYANNGTNNGATATAGQIGGAASITGNGITASSNNFSTGSGPFTMSLWYQTNSPPVSGMYEGLLSYGSASLNNANGLFLLNSSGVYSVFWSSWGNTIVGARSLNPGTWNLLVVTYDGNNITFYENGVVDNSTAASPAVSGGTPFNIGSWFSSHVAPGSFDEVRVSNVARPASWLTAEYNNQSSPSTFYTLAPQN